MEDEGLGNFYQSDQVEETPIPNDIVIDIGEEDNKKSLIWKEYTVISSVHFSDGKKRAKCAHCVKSSFIAESDYGTTNMKRHLENCSAYQAYLATKPYGGEREQQRFDQKVYRDKVAKAIVVHGYGFSWVEHKGNRDIHAYLNNQVKSITINTAKADCLALNAQLRKELKDTLLTLPGRICLTSDIWTSCQTEKYLCLTAHYVDSNWKLKSKILNFRHLEPPYTKSILCGVLFDLVLEWGIEHKLFSITLDDASSNDKMLDGLRFKLYEKKLLLNGGEYFHIRCATHTLDLIVKDGLKAIDGCVVKVRESVKYLNGSDARKKTFEHCVRRAMIMESKALWLDVPTKWNSTFFMLERALIYRRAFRELSLMDHMYTTLPTEDEWDRIARIHELLCPFCDITDLFAGSEYPTANLYFEYMWEIDMLLNEESKSSDPIIQQIVMEMRAKFDKYLSEYTLLFAFAMVLDPRCKLAFLRFCYTKVYGSEETAFIKTYDIKSKLEMLLKEYTGDATIQPIVPSSNTIRVRSINVNGKRTYDYFAEFDDNYDNGGKTLLDTYLEDPRLERKTKIDVLGFWKNNEDKYKELSYLARDVLSVPLTTVASESPFSIGDRILTKWKNSYIPENVEALITTRSWLTGFESNGDEEFTGSFVEWASPKVDRPPPV